MRITTSMKRERTITDALGREAEVVEELEVVGRIVEVDGEEQAVADSVDGWPRESLSEWERNDADEALWFRWLETESERQVAQGEAR